MKASDILCITLFNTLVFDYSYWMEGLHTPSSDEAAAVVRAAQQVRKHTLTIDKSNSAMSAAAAHMVVRSRYIELCFSRYTK